MAGFALIASADAVHTNSAESIVGYYTAGGQAVKYAGGLLSCAGLLALLPFIATMAGRVHGPDPSVDLPGSSTRLTGAAYVILCLASQAAGGAALWLGAHGDDASPIVALNALRAFTYYSALLALAAFLLAVGVGGLAGGRLARWMPWSALVVGTTLAIGVAVAQTGLADIASLLALAWIVAVSVGLLRRPGSGPVADRR